MYRGEISGGRSSSSAPHTRHAKETAPVLHADSRVADIRTHSSPAHCVSLRLMVDANPNSGGCHGQIRACVDTRRTGIRPRHSLYLRALTRVSTAVEVRGIDGSFAQNRNVYEGIVLLDECMKHHLEEEQEELFPQCRKVQMDLKSIGAAVTTRKTDLASRTGGALVGMNELFRKTVSWALPQLLLQLPFWLCHGLPAGPTLDTPKPGS